MASVDVAGERGLIEGIDYQACGDFWIEKCAFVGHELAGFDDG